MDQWILTRSQPISKNDTHEELPALRWPLKG